MRLILSYLTISVVLSVDGYGQIPQFEVVSIKAAAPASSFHSSESLTGGPGSSDRGMFHCTCTVAALITKAFELQRYQIPGYPSLPTDTFEVSAKIPVGTTQEQFLMMIQSLLKDRFGLAWHFEKKEVQGYQLVVEKSGPKLQESNAASATPNTETHGGHNGGGRYFGHAGLMNFNGRARYRGDHQTMDELAILISTQIGKPVDDQTGLKGKYDIALSWSGDVTPHTHHEGVGGHTGGYGDHSGSVADDASGPTIFEALQSQLGLKLVATKKSVARMFVVDHIEKAPTAN
jgi:uncharacterized protein (TIGR03435 family)